MKKVSRPRLPPPFPVRPPARVVIPVPPAPVEPPPPVKAAAKAPDDVVDLGDDLVEDFLEEVTVQGAAPLPPPKRERFRTLRSIIPAQLAESMATINRDRAAAAPLPLREQPESVTTAELTLPSMMEGPGPADDQQGRARAPEEVASFSPVPSEFATDVLSAPSFAATTSATTVVRAAPRA